MQHLELTLPLPEPWTPKTYLDMKNVPKLPTAYDVLDAAVVWQRDRAWHYLCDEMWVPSGFCQHLLGLLQVHCLHNSRCDAK